MSCFECIVLINQNKELPEMTKILVYEMFVQDVPHYFTEDHALYSIEDRTFFHNVDLLREYCQELKAHGQVSFM